MKPFQTIGLKLPGRTAPCGFGDRLFRTVRARPARKIGHAAAIAALAAALLLAAPFDPQPRPGPVPAQADTLVVGNDPGGRLDRRVELIRRLRATGTSVRITGAYCNSACTMYLGLPNACVAPTTVFGFHGPSSQIYGVGLAPAEFERWSRVMADHYPSPIRGWFLREARYVIVGMSQVRGSDLIRLGVRSC